MVTASKVICLKDITPTSCANFTISIFPKKFFGDRMSPVSFLIMKSKNMATLYC